MAMTGGLLILASGLSLSATAHIALKAIEKMDSAIPTTEAVAPSCSVPTEEQAQALLVNSFPNMKLIASAPVSGIEGCLREVELLADSERPDTQGFVYVLPGAQHFLNGPLMDRTSLIQLASDDPVISEPSDPDVISKQARDLEVLIQMTQILDRIERDRAAGNEGKDARIDEVKEAVSKLPYQFEYFPWNRNPIYIVFDPQCPSCKKQFEKQSLLAERYDARPIWIPTYLNEESRQLGAQLIRASESSVEEGRSLLKALMSDDGINSEDLKERFGTPSERHFKAIDEATVYLRTMMREQELGTPLILFSQDTGESELFNGYAELDEFELLGAGQ